VSAVVPGLNAGETYHYRLSATTAGGTTTGADQTLTTEAGPGVPTIGKTANVIPVTGTVYVKPPPGKSLDALGSLRSVLGITKGVGFVPITEARQVPIGSQFDARKGTVNLVAASTQPAVTQTVRLAGGVFDVQQVKSGLKKGLTTFTLREGLFPGAPSFKGCPTKLHKAGKSAVGRISKVPKAALQTLKAKDKGGKFQTKGKYSAGTVRGTSWTTTDRCDGTLTKVKRGIVSVRNFALRKTVQVKAGKRYLAKATDRRKRKRKRHK
jgi:hypothetical protein